MPKQLLNDFFWNRFFLTLNMDKNETHHFKIWWNLHKNSRYSGSFIKFYFWKFTKKLGLHYQKRCYKLLLSDSKKVQETVSLTLVMVEITLKMFQIRRLTSSPMSMCLIFFDLRDLKAPSRLLRKENYNRISTPERQ